MLSGKIRKSPARIAGEIIHRKNESEITMTLEILVNGAKVLSDSKFEKTRSAVAGIMATKNVDTVTVKSALDFVGGEAFADSLATMGEDSDVVEVVEDSKPVARYTRKNLVNRIRVALTVADWSGEIFTDKKESKSAVAQEVAGF